MPKTPQIVSGDRPAEKLRWWEEWVDIIRRRGGQFDLLNGEKVFWGEHLFLGSETHKELGRKARAVGVKANTFSDDLEYHEVTDLRFWQETKPAPLLLHEKILREHCYIVGPTGTGKTSLAIMPILIQLMRGSQTSSVELSPPPVVFVFDFKGDPALFHTVRLEAELRGQKFRFYTTEIDRPTYRFNPFRGFDRSQRSVPQLCQSILDPLGLNFGRGYGRSYYTERSRYLLSMTLKRYPRVASFSELHAALRSTVSTLKDPRAKTDAFELLSVIASGDT